MVPPAPSSFDGPAPARERAREPDGAPSPRDEASGRDEHLARLRGAGEYGGRARAALALARVIDPETTAALVAALRDPSSEVAAQAAEALAHHRGDVATSALRGVLENREGYFSPEARASAVRALGALLPAGDAGPIVGALGDVDALVSLAAVATLAERDEIASAGALMGVLEDRRGFYLPLTRHAAARALGRLHQYDRDRLHGVLAVEYDDVVREALAPMTN
jgi:HEAT repeat protein